ncbi:MAG: SDR family oxidoreductase [Planctomyces sp.]|nr:SDR family oxidoreductase [Planctomyces sp.]
MTTEARSKTVVITGATRGLGRALVDRFAESGWVVVGCGRSPDGILQLAERQAAPHAFSAIDVTDADAVADWAQHVLATFGPPDLLVNNAGVINETAPLWEVSADEFARVVDVNLKGMHHVLRGFLPAMVQRRSGVVVNLSSGWGRSTSAGVAPYCATKWGVEGLTQALALDVPRGMAAVALNPGVIDTDMLRSCFGGSAATYPSPETWSRSAAPFLMGLTARHNGQSLTVPGVPT